jgi:hypothetical protein
MYLREIGLYFSCHKVFLTLQSYDLQQPSKQCVLLLQQLLLVTGWYRTRCPMHCGHF